MKNTSGLSNADKKIVNEFYRSSNEYFSTIDSHNESNFGQYIEILKPMRGISLDVGCGTGFVSICIAKKGHPCYGIDISPIAVKMAEDRALSSNTAGKTEFRVSSPTVIPYPNDFFEKVGAFAVIEHFTDPESVFGEMIRVLKPDGLLIIQSPNFLSPFVHQNEKGYLDSKVSVAKIFCPQSYKNFSMILSKFLKINNTLQFSAKNLQYIKTGVKVDGDKDAVFMANPQDIAGSLSKSTMKIELCSSFSLRWQNNTAIKAVNLMPILKYFGPTTLIIARKRISV